MKKVKTTVNLNQNHNGMVFPKDVINKAVKDYMEKSDKFGGFGEIVHPERNLGDISCEVEKMSVDDKGEILADLRLLDTPKGNITQTLVDANMEFDLKPQILYSLKPTNTQESESDEGDTVEQQDDEDSSEEKPDDIDGSEENITEEYHIVDNIEIISVDIIPKLEKQ